MPRWPLAHIGDFAALLSMWRGAVVWEVVKGEGAFAGASGIMTSNFTVDAVGNVTDNQFAVLFVA